MASDKPQYPGTNTDMKPGDVLYSKKSLSTFFVGHVAIVGPDYDIIHVHPKGPGIVEDIDSYVSRFSDGDKIKVLRPRKGASKAAKWAINHINDVEKYYFNMDLDNIELSYCSKFIWHAFYYGYDLDITGRGLTDRSRATHIYPNDVRDSEDFASTVTINV
ncbi:MULTISPECIES: hypothetical protein [Brevibacillus]|uniref:hypothetical protein n=1 Tax=Brevibacillus TaxID=55080 RepID=UPI000D0E931D|nr:MULTISPECIES: hypothetical protein [Brevibacillus]PSJ69195.1 hypothetical protein C7J99_10865 [Brevibacillus brevis]RED27517.1 hypothetical protein DES34_110210 [Brevibacillus brevis]TQK53721.1 hypothetical protein FB479_109199 [Brevibacillus sp. AG162]VEF91370.1 Uncharacterized distant relative of cell wall-associated hydrolases [Brevibacillus brevis]GEC93270.1 hypothetical protein BBR01nite_56010 [Brevibacillus brevis]